MHRQVSKFGVYYENDKICEYSGLSDFIHISNENNQTPGAKVRDTTQVYYSQIYIQYTSNCSPM